MYSPFFELYSTDQPFNALEWKYKTDFNVES